MAIEASAVLTARLSAMRPARATLRARAAFAPPPPPSLTARAAIVPPAAPMLTAQAVLHGEPQPPPVQVSALLTAKVRLIGQGVRQVPASAMLAARATLAGEGVRRVPVSASLTARPRLMGQGIRQVPASAALTASARLAGEGVRRVPASGRLTARAVLIAIAEPPSPPIPGPLSLSVVRTGDTLEVIVSHWKEGDIEPPLTLMVRDKDGQPQDLTGRTVEIIAAPGPGYPPLVRREAVVAEGGDIRPGSKPGEILMPWRPGETRPGVYEVMLRVDDERSSPAQGYGIIIIERRLG